MKHRKLLLLAFFIFLMGCIGRVEDDFIPMDQQFKPIIIERSALESSVLVLPPQAIIKSGKIYVKDSWLFINEVNKGFHVFNYSNPQSPQSVAFIQILGATDLAVRNNTIYINQAVDLLTLSYDPVVNSITQSYRNRNVFPQKPSPSGFLPSLINDQIIIDWEQI